ncbi:hypothetical protein, partial [Acinetobacter baumannii]
FVADGTGGHAFADSLEGHQRNVTRWRQVERSRQQSQQADPTAVDKVDPNTAEPNAGQPGTIPGRSSAYAPGSNAAL